MAIQVPNIAKPRPWRPGATKPEWWVILAFVLLLSLVDMLHDYVSRRAEGTNPDWRTELLFGSLYWLPCFAVIPIVILLQRRFPIRFDRPAGIAIHAAAALVFAYAHSLIQATFESEAPNGRSYWSRFAFDLQADFAADYVFYCVIVALAEMIRQYAGMRESELRQSQLQTSLTQLRLDAIEAQLNPHFLFNTLQAISVMAMSGEQHAVVDMLGRLSALLRGALDKNRPHTTSLDAEVEFIQSYLQLQKLSFGDRLQSILETPANTLSAKVPTMILQPLVENAIVHGISIKPGTGIIRIRSSLQGEQLRLEVSDNGKGFMQSGAEKKGIGLDSTESRLELLYPGRHRLELGASDLGGAQVVITIPFDPSTDAAAGSALPLVHP